MLAGPLSYAAWLRMSKLSWAKQSIMNCVLKQGLAVTSWLASNKLRKEIKQSSKAFAAICTVSSFWICGQGQQAGTRNDTDLRYSPTKVCTQQAKENQHLLPGQSCWPRCRPHPSKSGTGWTGCRMAQDLRVLQLERASIATSQAVKASAGAKQLNANWPRYICLDF